MHHLFSRLDSTRSEGGREMKEEKNLCGGGGSSNGRSRTRKWGIELGEVQYQRGKRSPTLTTSGELLVARPECLRSLEPSLGWGLNSAE